MKSVLIVDEDAFTRNAFARTLLSRGFTVRHAASGLEALRAVAQEAVDLVVIDATLADTRGIELARGLRQMGASAQVVLLSSVFESEPAEERRMTQELGVSLILRKPISPVELCAQIEHVFDLSVEIPRSTASDDVRESRAEDTRVAYRAVLAETLERFETAVAGLRASGDSMAPLRGQLADMRGSALRHGFFPLSRAVGRIEARLTEIDTTHGDDAAWADVYEALDDALLQARPPAELIGASEAERAAARVLVVDADEEFLQSVTRFGREHFVDVYTATNADEALEVLRFGGVDALLIDVGVGDARNGFDFVREVRGRAVGRQLQLGFIADRGTVPDRVMAAHLGASVFVEKPVDSAQFADIVHRLVSIQPRDQLPVVVIVGHEDALGDELCAMLKRERMEPVRVPSAAALVERIDDLTPDGLIVSAAMPGIGGFDLCRMVRAMPRWHDLPILLLGRRFDAQTRIAAFQSGADDYLIDPPIREELVARLNVRIDRLRLLREQASFDLLTGLLSRRPFLQRVNAELSEARRDGEQVALALIDLDGFKKINDTFGHITGDRILAAFGRLLTNRFRMEDLRGRWGGEEFVVALIGEEAHTAERVLQRTLEEFRSLEFVGEQGEHFHVTFSAGVAVFPTEGETFRELLEVADERLYAAKARGKNCIVA